MRRMGRMLEPFGNLLPPNNQRAQLKLELILGVRHQRPDAADPKIQVL
jgi:hypothetical protein